MSLGHAPSRPALPLTAQGVASGAGATVGGMGEGIGGAARGLERLGGRRSTHPEPGEADAQGAIASFSPLPSVLVAPTSPSAAPAPGTSAHQAELQAMAERVLSNVKVGRLADGSATVRLRVDGGGGADLRVDLHHTERGLEAVVASEDGDHGRASEWSERLASALRERGVTLGSLELG